MPKSRTRKKAPGKHPETKIDFGANVGKTTGRTYLVTGVVVVLVVTLVGFFWWQNQQSESEISGLASEGQAALSRVKTPPLKPGAHLQQGQSQVYDERFPTSGSHDPFPVKAGFYGNVLPRTRLLHSMEHGNIVIYYEKPGPEAIARLKEWTSLYDGQLDGVIASVAVGLGEVVVMTAWNKSLRLNKFDAAAAAAFIDKFRGRGPEATVR
ncbi:MAG: DUF3105 domain-containing protein [Halocynthiibacter sp.]